MTQEKIIPNGEYHRAQQPIPTPRYRHATPSGPWPFLDIRDSVPTEPIEVRPKQGRCKHNKETTSCNDCLEGYPQSLFPNWTRAQQDKSGIHEVARQKHACSMQYVEMAIDQKGCPFSKPEMIHVDGGNYESGAEELRQVRARKVMARAIFVDGISGPALKMLGTIYDIEPFYFSSSIGWTPSRFQDSLDPQLRSDHITVTLRFVRKIAKPVRDDYMTSDKTKLSERSAIDVHKPLPLDDSALQPDLLAFHMIRSKYDSTIISYHCNETHGSTSATDLCARLQLVGRSVYWSKLFQEYRDATFVLVSLLWYALYSWDEAIEGLYDKIRKLEARVMTTLDPFEMTDIMNNLHTIRAHMLFYNSLLADFQKAVVFVKNTRNPALAGSANREQARGAIEKECNHILQGIGRIEKDCQMQDMRLKNATNLGYSRSNIYDTRQTTKLTEAQVRDSAAMKQISYLTMIFLPALFTASVFGMNVPEINPGTKPQLWTYIVSVISMTVLTVWLVGALQLPYMAFDVNAAAAQEAKKNGGHNLLSRLLWPIILIQTSLTNKAENRRMRGLEYE